VCDLERWRGVIRAAWVFLLLLLATAAHAFISVAPQGTWSVVGVEGTFASPYEACVALYGAEMHSYYRTNGWVCRKMGSPAVTATMTVVDPTCPSPWFMSTPNGGPGCFSNASTGAACSGGTLNGGFCDCPSGYVLDSSLNCVQLVSTGLSSAQAAQFQEMYDVVGGEVMEIDFSPVGAYWLVCFASVLGLYFTAYFSGQIADMLTRGVR
jgi:hypothetical protein